MALNDNYYGTVKDLKATFFDLFSEHISELAKMIESIANEEVKDAVKVESAIFQRIILLDRTAGNVKMIGNDMDNLNSFKGVGLEEIVTREKKAVAPSKKNPTPSKVSSENVTAAIPQPAVDKPVSNTSVAVVSTPDSSSKSVVEEKSASAASKPVINKNEAPVASQPVINENKAVIGGVIQQPVVPNPTVTPVGDTKVSDMKQDSSTVPSTNSVETTKKATFKFIKNSNNKVKAILVNDRQYNNLKASFARQARSLDFGASSTSGVVVSKEKIEDLMRKASALYKEGKVKEAQELYAQISSMNKELNKQQGRANVLIKKAA